MNTIFMICDFNDASNCIKFIMHTTVASLELRLFYNTYPIIAFSISPRTIFPCFFRLPVMAFMQHAITLITLTFDSFVSQQKIYILFFILCRRNLLKFEFYSPQNEPWRGLMVCLFVFC